MPHPGPQRLTGEAFSDGGARSDARPGPQRLTRGAADCPPGASVALPGDNVFVLQGEGRWSASGSRMGRQGSGSSARPPM